MARPGKVPASARPAVSKSPGRSCCDDRGKAIRLLTRYLFEREQAGRVQASTWVENHAMRRVFQKLGFVEEGVLHAYMPSERGRDDYVVYAIVSADRGKLDG